VDAGVLRNIATNVAGYFRDFLESDFKKVQVPSRRIILQTEQGFRAGMRLKPYQQFHADVWKLLQRPSGEALELELTPRKYTRQLSPTLKRVIDEQIAAISEGQIRRVHASLAADISASYSKGANDPESWIASAAESLMEAISAEIVKPLIARIDAPMQRDAYNVIDSLYAAEIDMITLVAAGLANKLPDILAKHHAVRDDLAVATAIGEFLTLEATQAGLRQFFDGFIAADAIQEFRDIETYASISEGISLYLYLGAIKFGGNLYPLFFLPISVVKREDGSGYILTLINQLFANRAAIDYILQEKANTLKREWSSPITDRIIYLQPTQSIFEESRRLFEFVANTMDLAGQAKLGSQAPDMSTADVVLSSALHLCAFEKGAEALVNDYEQLIDLARKGGGAIVDLFEGMVRGIIEENPKSIRAAVDAEWDGLPMVDRMVFDSPIPLNEEQRKILLAVRNPEGRIVVVEGPPGTGKSHTITAIAADCASTQRSCLVLSDKLEALEVVQNKLSEAMSRVRHDPNFPNPLLRLGREQANFKKLVANQTVNQVISYARVMSQNATQIEAEREETTAHLKSSISTALEALGSIDIRQVQRMHTLESNLDIAIPGFTAIATSLPVDKGIVDALKRILNDSSEFVDYLDSLPADVLSNASQLLARSKLDHATGKFMSEHLHAVNAFSAFETLNADQVRSVLSITLQYRQLRMPIFGYLLRGSSVRALEAQINALPVQRPLILKKEAAVLELIVSDANGLRQQLERAELTTDALPHAYRSVARGENRGAAASVAITMLTLFAKSPQLLALILSNSARNVVLALQYIMELQQLRLSFASVPEFDYAGLKERLERLNTTRMNAHVDTRLVHFMENHRADARILASLISQRQKFPDEKFEAVRQSFPVIIASIREFGEYMPLMPEMFDVVVIDEGSQVSVAQALPALLRAKKVVVLGDTKQFANVKSSNASIATNEKYRAALLSNFRKNVRSDAQAIERLSMFDVKRSILEFCSLAANYSIMLRKHFRSYPELIGYSSRTFYDSQLQAIKIRGVPLTEVIRFDQVDPSVGTASRSTNTAEADFIQTRLEAFLDQDVAPTVGIITPFREQHTLLTKRLFAHPRMREFEDRLKLKIMTFDSCQGEERKVVFYSMVASTGFDALNYIFPVDPRFNTASVEDKLKVQRLNVGFSRAQESIWIVHSQPLDQFRGAIGQALNYYANVLSSKLGDASQTDPNSPMEAKVLDWLQRTPFVTGQPENVEIVPQFPLGEYLKQLDSMYQHPAYRVDFLVKCRTEKGLVQIVVEYDGFEHHFEKGRNIHVGNHQRYLNAADVERQLTLESYGYRFIRINRFNLSDDPVGDMNNRLVRIVETTTGERHSKIVERLREQAAGIAGKKLLQCTKCKAIKPLVDFWDPALKDGAGGQGRKCIACKDGISKEGLNKSTNHAVAR